MNIYLDDTRPAPSGWVLLRWPSEVIERLETCNVQVISLDHDLGDDVRGTGYDVLLWIERAVACTGYTPPEIRIHTANIAARRRMEQAREAIEKRVRARPE